MCRFTVQLFNKFYLSVSSIIPFIPKDLKKTFQIELELDGFWIDSET